MRSRAIRSFPEVIFAIAFLAMAARSSADFDPPRELREMDEIVASDSLATTQKFQKIGEYLRDIDSWPVVFQRLAQVDKARAQETALRLLRNPRTPRQKRLQLSRYLLRTVTRGYQRQPDEPAEFISEYREFLIDAILDGGLEEFLKVRTGDLTAVGEYAGIAGGINRPPGVFFSEVRTQSVIPILIQCLAAPDHVHGNELSCVVVAPGSPTGRNTQRQGIPFALARLQATEAIPALEAVVRSHHDLHLRMNALFALDVLRPLAKVQALEQKDANTGMQEIH